MKKFRSNHTRLLKQIIPLANFAQRSDSKMRQSYPKYSMRLHQKTLFICICALVTPGIRHVEIFFHCAWKHSHECVTHVFPHKTFFFRFLLFFKIKENAKNAKVYEKCYHKRIFVTIISNFSLTFSALFGDGKKTQGRIVHKTFILLILMIIFISTILRGDFKMSIYC